MRENVKHPRWAKSDHQSGPGRNIERKQKAAEIEARFQPGSVAESQCLYHTLEPQSVCQVVAARLSKSNVTYFAFQWRTGFCCEVGLCDGPPDCNRRLLLRSTFLVALWPIQKSREPCFLLDIDGHRPSQIALLMRSPENLPNAIGGR